MIKKAKKVITKKPVRKYKIGEMFQDIVSNELYTIVGNRSKHGKIGYECSVSSIDKVVFVREFVLTQMKKINKGED
jgi:hypothetical protein